MRCHPCERANIVCSLAPDFILPRQDPPNGQVLVTPSAPNRPKVTPHSQQKFIPSSYSPPLPSPLAGRPPSAPTPTIPAFNNTMSYTAQPSIPNNPPLPDNNEYQNPSDYSHNPSVVYDGTSDKNQPYYTVQDQQTSVNMGQESMGVWVKQVSEQPKLHQLIHEYLNSIDAFSMPLRDNRDGLINLYCNSIHPVLPLLDKDQFLKLHDIGQAPTLLLHAVLLVAARHPKAKTYLGSQPIRDFCSTTAHKIRALLYAEVEQDRLTLVRVYALLSLHSEGPAGLENSCCDLQKAIHYSISLGIHHERPFIDIEELRQLWWTVWCMDRINACVNARPLICNLEDVGAREISKSEHFNLGQLVESCKRLENVIYLYRPNPKTKRRLLLLDQDVTELPVKDGTSAVFALLHYTAVILAHKRGSEEASPSASSTSPPGTYTLDTPVSSQIFGKPTHRRTSSSSRPLNKPSPRHENSPKTDHNLENSRRVEFSNIILIRAAGFILNVIKNFRTSLPPLPLIPYCVSLTLTVFLRTSAKSDPIYGFTWRDGCAFLEAMSDQWWVAAAMGGMGRKAFGRLPNETHEGAYIEQHISDVPENVPPVQLKNEEPVISPPEPDVTYVHTSLESPIVGVPMEEQFLDMFSQLPNATSFLDEALATEHFEEINEWFQ